MSEGVDYASSGVDIDLESTAVASLVDALSRSVRQPGELGAPVDLPGGFGGLIEFGDSLLALATDGVGSKLQLASQLKAWAGIGHDCMAMNVNDLLCVGAEPIAFVNYIATPKPEPEVHAALGKSLGEAAVLARVTLAGGETASLPGIVTELDLSGTALGWLPKDATITGERISEHDVLIGLPSSGFHSNGYSLVRKVLELCDASLEDEAPFKTASESREILRFTEDEVSLGEVLLNPTRIYVDPVVELIQTSRDGSGPCPAKALHGICHVTGGGLSNLLRLHPEFGYHIGEPLEVPPEFGWIQSMGKIDEREMYRTFNMGCGMIIIVSNYCAESTEYWLKKRLPGTRIIGEVRTHGHKVSHVHPDVLFEHY